MINIISVNIKQGGGLILLDLLIVNLINYECKATIHVDQTMDFTKYEHNDFVEFKYYNNFLSKINLFGKSLPNALYFGNIPPYFSRAKIKYLYFHNSFYTKKNGYLLKNRFYKFLFHKIYISLFIKNVNSIFVQTNTTLRLFKKEFRVMPELFPFFDDLTYYNNNKKTLVYNFSYISLPNPNKNLEVFLDSLIILNDKLKTKIKIALTVPSHNLKLIKKIRNLDGTNIKIINFGEVSKQKIIEVVKNTETLVFPSLDESFGLPLVEACQLGAYVICSDLPYAYDVIIPSATFNPNSKDHIAETMFMSLETRLKKPKILIENKMEELIYKLKQ